MNTSLDFFGPRACFHHIGMAVRSIGEAVPGLTVVTDPIQRVSIGFVEFSGLTVELIEPAGENSPIDGSLKKGNKILHVCIEVPSIANALDECKQHGFRKISEAVPATVFENRKIVWVFSSIFGLVELLEAKEATG